tara:strand:- start:2534 stop:3655 length:1122 start_codon:yes stop_codon:yes gene_type:complete
MYLPKHQYTVKTIEELGLDFKLSIPKGKLSSLGNKAIEKIAGTLGNLNAKVIATAFGDIFSTEGVNLETGDFTNAIKLLVSNGSDNPTLNDNDSRSNVTSVKLPPTAKNFNEGVVERYFYKNKCTGKVKEYNRTKYLNVLTTRTKCEEVIKVDWLIKGPAKDQLVNGYFLEGIESKNKKTLDVLAKKLPGTELLINGPSEYVKDSLPLGYNNPQPPNTKFDIPSPGTPVPAAKSIYKKNTSESYFEKSKENLLAESGEFIIEGTNREYVGLYHVHPTKGPMTGGRHVEAQHSRLVPRDNSKSRISTEIPNQRNTTSTNQKRLRSSTNQTSNSSGGYSSPSSTSTSIGGSSSGGSNSGGSSSGGSSSGGGYSGY